MREATMVDSDVFLKPFERELRTGFRFLEVGSRALANWFNNPAFYAHYVAEKFLVSINTVKCLQASISTYRCCYNSCNACKPN